MALRFASLLWLLSAAALTAACSLSTVAVVVVVVVGMVSCFFMALAPCVSGTRVNGARSVIRNAEAGGSTSGFFTPSLGRLILSLSLDRSAPIFVIMAAAATTARPLSLMLVISCRIVSSSSLHD